MSLASSINSNIVGLGSGAGPQQRFTMMPPKQPFDSNVAGNGTDTLTQLTQKDFSATHAQKIQLTNILNLKSNLNLKTKQNKMASNPEDGTSLGYQASKEQTVYKNHYGNQEVSSINDRVDSERNDTFSNYGGGVSSKHPSPLKNETNRYSDMHEGGELLTDNRNALDTDKMDGELLESASQVSGRNRNLNVPMRSNRSALGGKSNRSKSKKSSSGDSNEGDDKFEDTSKEDVDDTNFPLFSETSKLF